MKEPCDKRKSNGEGIRLCLTLIVDILMIGSFCTAVTETSLMSIVVLFALSYLGSFFESSKMYPAEKYWQKFLIHSGIIISMLLLGLCLTIAIGIMELRVWSEHGQASILIQSYENSFWCFNSIDVTLYMFMILSYPFIIHLLIYIFDRLEEKGIDITSMLKAIWKHRICVLLWGSVSIIIGCIICWGKYEYIVDKLNDLDAARGTPQYWKHALVFGVLGLGIGICQQGDNYVKKILIKEKVDIKDDKTVEEGR